MTTDNGQLNVQKSWKDYLYRLAVQMPLVAVLAIFLYIQRQDEAQNRELMFQREAERQEQFLKCNEELKATLKEMTEIFKEFKKDNP